MDSGSIERISSKSSELDRQRSTETNLPPDLDGEGRSKWFYSLIISNFFVIIGIAWTINNYKEGHDFGNRGSFVNWVALLLPYIILLVIIWMVIGRRLAEGESGRLILVTIVFVLIGIFTRIIPMSEVGEFIAYSTNDTTSNTTTFTPTTLNGTGLDPTNQTTPEPYVDVSLGDNVATLEDAINQWFMVVGPFILFAALLLFYYSIKKETKFLTPLDSDGQDGEILPYKPLPERNLDVVRLYSTTRNLLANEGVEDTSATTPTEFVNKAGKSVLDDNQFSDLTDVFELARFSDHEVTEKELKIAQLNVEKIEKKVVKKPSIEIDETTGDDSNG
ncbi:MAG: DUF4129 domain-containing protein [Candidatus Kariarchaeaceae archaeon]